MSEANEREDDAVPTEDPRQTGVSDQLPEESPEGQGAGDGGRANDAPEAPDTSPDGDGPEDDPGKATGNPGAAG